MTINQEQFFCASCSRLFYIRKCKEIYMCGDTYVCSKKCSEKRYFELKNIDPGFTRPHTWPLINYERSQSLFNSELISKTTNSQVSNINNHILKSQNEIYGTNFENEELIPFTNENTNIDTIEDYEEDFYKVNQNRLSRLCSRCFAIAIPSLCAISIIIVSKI